MSRPGTLYSGGVPQLPFPRTAVQGAVDTYMAHMALRLPDIPFVLAGSVDTARLGQVQTHRSPLHPMQLCCGKY